MKVNGKFIPKNSCKAQTLVKLEPEEQVTRVEAYEALDQRRRLLIVKIRNQGQAHTYSVCLHREIQAILEEAENLFPGITATQRSGWGRITGWLSNVSRKRLAGTPHLIMQELEYAANEGLFEQPLKTAREVISYLEWSIGMVISKASKNPEDLAATEDLLNKATKIAAAFKDNFKGHPEYDQLLSELTAERTITVNPSNKFYGVKEVVNLLCKVLSRLSPFQRAFLLYMAFYSPDYESVVACLATRSIWAMGYSSSEPLDMCEDFATDYPDFSTFLAKSNNNRFGQPVNLNPRTMTFVLC